MMIKQAFLERQPKKMNSGEMKGAEVDSVIKCCQIMCNINRVKPILPYPGEHFLCQLQSS